MDFGTSFPLGVVGVQGGFQNPSSDMLHMIHENP
jgi:hypothetical protein